jgi:hypothetical protein
MRVRTVLVVGLVLAAVVPDAAFAGLYKWVDADGVVNYGDTPPAGATKSTQLDETTSSLSVVPGLSKEELARARERDAQARVERLERELAELRAPPQLPAPVYDMPPPYYASAYYPLVVRRRFPFDHVQFPVHGAPVKKVVPPQGMRLDK